MCNRQLTDSTSGDRTLLLSFSFRSFTGVARPLKNAKLNGTAAVYHSINYEERPRNCFAARKRGEKVGGKKEKKKKKRAATNYGELCQVYGAPRAACRFHFDFCFFFLFFSKSRPSLSPWTFIFHPSFTRLKITRRLKIPANEIGSVSVGGGKSSSTQFFLLTETRGGLEARASGNYEIVETV